MTEEIFTLKIFTPSGITKENVFTEGQKVLHIGSGSSKLAGSESVDILKLPGVDVVHDLDILPWPYDNNSFDIIYAHSVFEHLKDIVATMDEMYRILKPTGRIVIAVPYFRHVDAFVDPTHEHFFTYRSLDYFIQDGNGLANYSYSKSRFRKVGFWFGWPQKPKNPIKRLLKKCIHTHPKFYEMYLSYFYPVQILVWELEVEK